MVPFYVNVFIWTPVCTKTEGRLVGKHLSGLQKASSNCSTEKKKDTTPSSVNSFRLHDTHREWQMSSLVLCHLYLLFLFFSSEN